MSVLEVGTSSIGVTIGLVVKLGVDVSDWVGVVDSVGVSVAVAVGAWKLPLSEQYCPLNSQVQLPPTGVEILINVIQLVPEDNAGTGKLIMNKPLTYRFTVCAGISMANRFSTCTRPLSAT